MGSDPREQEWETKKSETGKEGKPIPGGTVKLVTVVGFWGSFLLRSSERLYGCTSELSV